MIFCEVFLPLNPISFCFFDYIFCFFHTSDDVIIQHMDIREPLSRLRELLEERLAVDLSDYEFWLQDSQVVTITKIYFLSSNLFYIWFLIYLSFL